MIKGLFETHLQVANLEASMNFYSLLPGIELANVDENRRVAFYWVGKRGEAMLGLWEKSGENITSQHFAFRCAAEDIIDHAESFLNERSLAGYNFLNDGTPRPMVFAWMPAISIYFNDPDQHVLEFISMLPQEPKPEFGIVSYEEWLNISIT